SRLGDPQLSVHVGAGVVAVGEDAGRAGGVVPRAAGGDRRRGELAAVGLHHPGLLPLVDPADDRPDVGRLDLGVERGGGVVVVDVDLPDGLGRLRRRRGRGGRRRRPRPGGGRGRGGLHRRLRGGGHHPPGGGRRGRRRRGRRLPQAVLRLVLEVEQRLVAHLVVALAGRAGEQRQHRQDQDGPLHWMLPERLTASIVVPRYDSTTRSSS